MQKTVIQINEEVTCGGSVVVTAVAEPQPAPAAPVKVDAVTTATFEKNMYLPLMPVLVPPRREKD
jgi:uncharacterized protein (DUF39 family)